MNSLELTAIDELWNNWCWRIAGEERSRFMTSAFYRKAVGAFVVTDVTQPNGFEAATLWKKDLDTKLRMHDDSLVPSVLLINKVSIDLSAFDRLSLRKQYIWLATVRRLLRETLESRIKSGSSRPLLPSSQIYRMVRHLCQERHKYWRSRSVPRRQSRYNQMPLVPYKLIGSLINSILGFGQRNEPAKSTRRGRRAAPDEIGSRRG